MEGSILQTLSSIGFSIGYGVLFLALIPPLMLSSRAGWAYSHYGSRACIRAGERIFPIRDPGLTQVGVGRRMGINLAEAFEALSEADRQILFEIGYDEGRQAYLLDPDPEAEITLLRDGTAEKLNRPAVLENMDVFKCKAGEETYRLVFKVGE